MIIFATLLFLKSKSITLRPNFVSQRVSKNGSPTAASRTLLSSTGGKTSISHWSSQQARMILRLEYHAFLVNIHLRVLLLIREPHCGLLGLFPRVVSQFILLVTLAIAQSHICLKGLMTGDLTLLTCLSVLLSNKSVSYGDHLILAWFQ